MRPSILPQMRLWREPLVHFAVGGALLFALWALVQRGRSDAGPAAGAVTPRATVTAGAAAPARIVTVGASEIEAMRSSFRAGWKREPSALELADLVQEAISEEILFREGLARGLDRDDGVVRRRLIEKMTALVHPAAQTSDPSRDQLRHWYDTYSHRFARPAVATFDQLFFDPRRRANADADGSARAVLATLTAAHPSDAPPAGIGDSFVMPGRMTDKSEQELAHLYGEGFARAVMTATLGTWQGPLTSRYGAHLVRVSQRRDQRLPPFEEAEKYVRADWLTVETRGVRAAAESLLPRYEIVLPADLRLQIAQAPALAPFLRQIR